MRWHMLIWLLVALLLSGRADSRGFGNNMTGLAGGGGAVANCGTGAVDFTTSCALPMFGGL